MSKKSVVVVALLAFGHTAWGGSLVPNSKRYADRNPAAATGRSGNATASVSALRDKQGQTVVTVEAGSTDGAAGNITKLQLKAFNAAEEVAWVRNFTGLTGSTQRLTLPGFLRGQPIQTQATIRALDGARSDIVTTSGSVKLLPDLMVTHIDAPERTYPGNDVVITAVIGEHNGDVGARAACVLRVDGAEVDRAVGIWVDAGDSVACAFTYAFSSLGSKQLEVAVVDVAPADYDSSNNSRTVSIDVEAQDPTSFRWMASAASYRDVTKLSSQGWYEAADHSFGADWAYSQETDMRAESAALYGSKPMLLQFPISIRVTGVADGVLSSDIALTNQSPSYVYEDSESTYRNYSATANDGTTIWIYSYSYGGESLSGLEIARSALDVTYYSSGYMHQWWDYHGGESFYSFPPVGHFGTGSFWPMTSTYEGTWSVTDASGQSLAAAASMSLVPFNDGFQVPLTCAEYTDSITGYACQSQETLVTGVNAYVWGSTP